jgi:hypothetical protein
MAERRADGELEDFVLRHSGSPRRADIGGGHPVGVPRDFVDERPRGAIEAGVIEGGVANGAAGASRSFDRALHDGTPMLR